MDTRFKTPVEIRPFPFSIDYSQDMLLMGSCFAGLLGERLSRLKFKALCNPLGILFDPLSLGESLSRMASGPMFARSDIECVGDICFSFQAHGSLSASSPEACLAQLNTALEEARTCLQRASLLVVTMGTSGVFRHKTSGRVVANCHKLPPTLFVREWLTPQEVQSALERAISEVRMVNPDIEVLLTVSPVRHLKDGAHQNHLSKAVLLLAVDALCRSLPRVHYFPAYEVLLDELRDYRYYGQDMVHPSDLAADWIWDRFVESCMNHETKAVMKEVEGLVLAREHRQLHPWSEAARVFMHHQGLKAVALSERYPFLNLQAELQHFGVVTGD